MLYLLRPSLPKGTWARLLRRKTRAERTYGAIFQCLECGERGHVVMSCTYIRLLSYLKVGPEENFPLRPPPSPLPRSEIFPLPFNFLLFLPLKGNEGNNFLLPPSSPSLSSAQGDIIVVFLSFLPNFITAPPPPAAAPFANRTDEKWGGGRNFGEASMKVSKKSMFAGKKCLFPVLYFSFEKASITFHGMARFLFPVSTTNQPPCWKLFPPPFPLFLPFQEN